MKFFVSADIRKNDLLKLVVLFTTVFFVFLWITNLLLFLKVGLSYESVVEYYRGSEESFRPPRSYLGLLEEAHFHFFSMAVLLVTLNHLFLFTSRSSVEKLVVIVASYGSALLDIAGGWLIRYVSAEFAYLKISSFVVLQASLLYLMVVVTLYLYGKKDDRRKQPGSPPAGNPG